MRLKKVKINLDIDRPINYVYRVNFFKGGYVNDLKDIGFYTLEDERVKQIHVGSPLWRCELLITSKCNFKCPYCRGTSSKADITLKEAVETVGVWISNGLKNVRFSGGEPTIVEWLPNIVSYCKDNYVERIAISTNGSADRELYDDLLERGVNDFSISLDACCASVGDIMAGAEKGVWQKVVDNTKYLTSKTYVTVGVVLTEETVKDVNKIVKYASDELGVSDIRIISAAQWNGLIDNIDIEQKYLDRHPILKYRWHNIKKERNVRGINKGDNKYCPLMIDDMVVLGGEHYPCIIHLREGGKPIGKVNSPDMRKERLSYGLNHDTSKDPICKKNCLDVCVDYNNKCLELRGLGNVCE